MLIGISVVVFFLLMFFGLVIMFRNVIGKNVTSATKQLEEMSQEYAKKEAEIERQLEEIKRKSQEAVSKAQEEAQKQKEQIVKEAQTEKSKVLDAAQIRVDEMIQQAEKARQSLLSEIEQRIEEKALKRAIELLRQALPEALRQEIHNRWINDLISSSLEQLDRLRVDENVDQARVVSAFSLEPGQVEALKLKIREKLGRELGLKEDLEPDIISGVIVHIGSLVFDGSLKTKIQEIAYASK